jgi:hypothetical protein
MISRVVRFAFGKSGYPQENNMQDLAFVVITIVFFAVSIGYVHFCERIR